MPEPLHSTFKHRHDLVWIGQTQKLWQNLFFICFRLIINQYLLDILVLGQENRERWCQWFQNKGCGWVLRRSIRNEEDDGKITVMPFIKEKQKNHQHQQSFEIGCLETLISYVTTALNKRFTECITSNIKHLIFSAHLYDFA